MHNHYKEPVYDGRAGCFCVTRQSHVTSMKNPKSKIPKVPNLQPLEPPPGLQIPGHPGLVLLGQGLKPARVHVVFEVG